MAKSKRLKKKQQTKKVESYYKKKGYTKKEAKQKAHKQTDKEKALKALQLSERGKARTREMKKIGVPPEIRRKVSRTTSEKKYQSIIKEYKREYGLFKYGEDRAKNLGKHVTIKRPGDNGKVLMLWKDVTENVGKEFIDEQSEYSEKMLKDMGLKEVYRSAYGWSRTKVGEIGQYQVLVIDPKDYYRTLSHYPDYTKVYYGYGERYDLLLVKIRTMLIALYQPDTKQDFLKDLLIAFETVNPDVAKQLNYDFDLELY